MSITIIIVEQYNYTNDAVADTGWKLSPMVCQRQILGIHWQDNIQNRAGTNCFITNSLVARAKSIMTSMKYINCRTQQYYVDG